jgi:hypothetical protein
MDLFSNQRGRVTAIDSPGVPMSLFLEGWGGYFGFKSIITQVRVIAQGGVQFMHTLRDFIYIYVFGERISQMNISGLSFFAPCGSANGCHGLEYVNAYYLFNRVSQRATPVTMVLGCGTPFFGFLVGMVIDLNNPEDLIGQFNLDFRVVPEQSNLG